MKYGRRGNTLIEAAMFIPILLTFLVATEQLGKLTYTYYSIQKALYSAARYVGTQQDVNFCDASDPNIVAALNLAVSGTTDGSGTALINGLTTDMITITAENIKRTRKTSSKGSVSTPDVTPAQDVLVKKIIRAAQTTAQPRRTGSSNRRCTPPRRRPAAAE